MHEAIEKLNVAATCKDFETVMENKTKALLQRNIQDYTDSQVNSIKHAKTMNSNHLKVL
jgi:hypothetical protein